MSAFVLDASKVVRRGRLLDAVYSPFFHLTRNKWWWKTKKSNIVDASISTDYYGLVKCIVSHFVVSLISTPLAWWCSDGDKDLNIMKLYVFPLRFCHLTFLVLLCIGKYSFYSAKQRFILFIIYTNSCYGLGIMLLVCAYFQILITSILFWWCYT